MENLNSEMMRYKRLAQTIMETLHPEAMESVKDEKCECGSACSGKMKTEAKPSAVWDKPMNLSFVDAALTRIEAAQAKGQEPDKKDMKILELAKKVTENKPLTDEEIAMIFGVSKMAISKIEQKALGTARKFIKKTPGREDQLKDLMRSEPKFKQHEPEKKENPID